MGEREKSTRLMERTKRLELTRLMFMGETYADGVGAGGMAVSACSKGATLGAQLKETVFGFGGEHVLIIE